VVREIKILSRLNHSAIMKLFEAIESRDSVYLVMELVDGDSLHAHLKAQPNRRFSEEKVKQIVN
jgi:serine/threonine protein kinase